MSIEKLELLTKDHARACKQGMPWIVLAKAIRKEEPNGLHTVQAAENNDGASFSWRA